MAEDKVIEQVNTPMDERQLSALDFIKTSMGNSVDFKIAKVDAVRKAVIEYARALGWKDPALSPQPESPARKAIR